MKYKLINNGHFFCERTEYEPGEPVTVLFLWMATDTSYEFFIDADDVKQEYVNSRMEFRFTMPCRDVAMSYESRSSMMMGPGAFPGFPGMGAPAGKERHDDAESSDGAPLSEGEWVCECCGDRNKGRFCSECGSPRPKRGRAIRRCK